MQGVAYTGCLYVEGLTVVSRFRCFIGRPNTPQKTDWMWIIFMGSVSVLKGLSSVQVFIALSIVTTIHFRHIGRYLVSTALCQWSPSLIIQLLCRCLLLFITFEFDMFSLHWLSPFPPRLSRDFFFLMSDFLFNRTSLLRDRSPSPRRPAYNLTFKRALGTVNFCVNIVDQCEACLTLKSLEIFLKKNNLIVQCKIIDQLPFVSSWATRIICNQALLLVWSSSSAARIVPAGLRLGCCPPLRAANWWKRENSPGTNLQGCAYQENRKVKHFQWTGIKIDSVISCWVLTYIRKL